MQRPSSSSSVGVTWRVLAMAGLAFSSLTSGFVPSGMGGGISSLTPVQQGPTTALHARRRTMDASSSAAVLEPSTTAASTKRKGRRHQVNGPTPVSMEPTTSESLGRRVELLTPQDREGEELMEFTEQELRTRHLIKDIQRGHKTKEAIRASSQRSFTAQQLTLIREGQKAQVELLDMYTPVYKSIITKYVKAFGASNLNSADLETEAQAALIEAAYRFDFTRANKFSSFAWTFIRNSVLASIQSQVDFIKTPSSVLKQRTLLNNFHKEYTKQHNTLPTVEEAAQSLNLSENRVQYLIKYNSQAVKLEKQMTKSGDRMVDMILDPGMQSSLSGYINTRLSSRIDQAMEKLTEEEAMVLTARLGLRDGQPKTLEEIRQGLDGCSLQYLRKLETRAKQHLMRDLDLIKFVNDQLPKLESLDKSYTSPNSPLIRVRR